MIIREALLSDLKSVYLLIQALENKNFDLQIFRNLYEENLQNTDFHYFVAENESKVIGFISTFEYNALHNCHKVLEIQELIVDHTYRGQNIGANLLTEVENLARQLNCPLIELTSNKFRVKAHAFYIRNGYQRDHFRFKKKID